MTALKENLNERPNQPSQAIEQAVNQLKSEFDFDQEAIMQLQFAICVYQSVVTEVLRSHQIKPHWMFALDNLTRSSVTVAINAFNPEIDIVVPSVSSTVNSQKSLHHHPTEGFHWRDRSTTTDLVGLMTEVQKQQLEVQRLLTRVIETNNALLQRLPIREVMCEREDVIVDQRVRDWLETVAITEKAKRIFLSHNFNWSHLMSDISKDDLRSTGLTAGTVLTLMSAILKLRTHHAQNATCNGL